MSNPFLKTIVQETAVLNKNVDKDAIFKHDDNPFQLNPNAQDFIPTADINPFLTNTNFPQHPGTIQFDNQSASVETFQQPSHAPVATFHQPSNKDYFASQSTVAPAAKTLDLREKLLAKRQKEKKQFRLDPDFEVTKDDFDDAVRDAGVENEEELMVPPKPHIMILREVMVLPRLKNYWCVGSVFKYNLKLKTILKNTS